jgi:aryl-alcohol dehydrogenase-like predicted oxidoreductase
VLTGKYDPDAPPPPDTRAASEEMGGVIGSLMKPELLHAVQRLKPIAEESGLTLPQFALAWILREPNIASAIVGASRASQVRENAGASGARVAPQLFLRAEEIIKEAVESTEPA